jgi:hypothetical protein
MGSPSGAYVGRLRVFLLEAVAAVCVASDWWRVVSKRNGRGRVDTERVVLHLRITDLK